MSGSLSRETIQQLFSYVFFSTSMPRSRCASLPRLLAALVGAIRRQLQFFTNAEVDAVGKNDGKTIAIDGIWAILLDFLGF